MDWWILAGPRWVVPSTDITVRQSLVDDAPIVRTAVRAGRGDVVGHTYATRQGRREVAVIELTNTTDAPVLVAVVVSGVATPGVVAGATMLADGVSVVHLSSAPRAHVGLGAGERLAPVLASLAGTPDAPDGKVGPGTVALLPLTHGTSLRIAIPMDLDASAVERSAVPVLPALAGPDDVARGWAAHRRDAVHIEFDDDGPAARLRSLTATLVLAAEAADHKVGGPVTSLSNDARLDIATALARCGHIGRAQTLIDGLQVAPGRKGELRLDDDDAGTLAVVRTAQTISALGMVLGAARDLDTARSVAASVAGAAEFVLKANKSAPGPTLGCLPFASTLLRMCGENRGADDALRAWERAGRMGPVPRAALDPLPAVNAGASLVPDDPRRAAAEVHALLDGFATDQGAGMLDLLPVGSAAGSVPEYTRPGASVVVRGLQTSAGPLGFALRWHGPNPALLWEVADPVGDVLLRASALSDTWQATSARGEGLVRR